MADATHYVSKTGNNGTAIANNPALPWLTIEAAVISATNGTSLDVIISDGEYIEDQDGHNYLYMSKTMTAVSLIAENDYGVTIKAIQAGSEFRTVLVSAITTMTFGKLIIDAVALGGTNQTHCVSLPSAGIPNVVFDGTVFLNYSGAAIFGDPTNLTLTNGWSSDIPSGANGFVDIDNSGGGAGTWLFEDGSLTFTDFDFTSNEYIFQFSGVTDAPMAVDGHTITIQRNNISGSVSSIVSDEALMVFNGVEQVNVIDNTVAITPPTGSPELWGCVVRNHATFLCDKVRVTGNTFDFGTNQSALAKYGIRIGEEGVTNRDRINDVIVDDNWISGADHSLMFGYITGAKAQGNSSHNGIIGALQKGCTNTIVNGMLTVDMSGQHQFIKGSSGATSANNTCIAKNIAPSISFLSNTIDGDALINSLSSVFTNNICYSEQTVVLYTNSTIAETASYHNNYFFSTVAEPANPFDYQTTTYSTVGAWQTAIDLTPQSAADNASVDPDISAVYVPLVTSPCVGSASKWWTGANPTGNDNEPFSDIDTDIGAVQTKFSTLHPVKL